MASQKKKWVAAASMGVLVAGGWLTYSLLAKQGQGTLAQAPLNIQVPATPAFLMALDDSGSMLWETLNPTRDGVYRWVQPDAGGSRITGFYGRDGVPYGYGEGGNRGQNYLYLTPSYGRDGNDALPPLDAYGFARSPDVNTAYFDPRDDYPAWKNGKLDPADPKVSDYATYLPTNVPLDARPVGASSRITGEQNLTAMERRTGANWRFTFRYGMVVPVGTVIEEGRCGDVTSPNVDSNANSVRDGDFRRVTRQVTLTGTCEAAVSYYPATVFLREKMPASYGYRDDRIVTVTNPLHGRPGTLYKYEIRSANFVNGDGPEYKAAIDNFTRWFAFYRTRRDALIGAATNALQGTENLRVGWFRINSRGNASMYSMTERNEKIALLADITKNMRASGSTPNRSAASHLGAQFSRPKTGSDQNPPVLLSCQKNAGMLFTDGYINETSNTTRMRRLVAPYYDNSLVPGIESNSVPIPDDCPDGKLDCKTSLHMNFYGVTLGTLGEQFGVTYLPDPKSPWVLTPNPYEQPPSFGTGTVDLAPGAVDELWEAVLYTHGEMVNATKPSDITSAMRRIISNVSKGDTPSGTRSLTGARIGTGSLSVEPFYEATNSGTDWYSTLTAYKMSVDPATRGIVSEKAWEASERMPAASARRVWVGRNGVIQRFNSNNVTLQELCQKPSGLYAGMTQCSDMNAIPGIDIDKAVSYLLGNTALEVRNGGIMRDRTTVLGDIINSTPLLTSPTDDYGYRTLGTIGTSYVQYLNAKRANRRYMVYAGANDGMLHAFDGGMAADGVLDNNGGKEVFGYIPSTALGHMGNLLMPLDPSAEKVNFEHRYFVDGQLVVGDIHSDGSWKTALVGSAGAGGRSVFALDVTDPTAFGTSSLLWELNDFNAALSDTVRNNIGHVLGKPVIVPVKAANGTVGFKAIFGNGVESRDGKAALFVVDMVAGAKPKVTTYVVEETGTNLPAGRNGLNNIVVVDRWAGAGQDVRGRDGYADTVYGADQKGAIWKFDLTSTASPTMPVFTTKTSVDNADKKTYRQPIMGGLTATAGPAGGVMLLFGTGSFSYLEDGIDTSVQGLYGVNDISGKAPTSTLTAANLRPITVSTGADGRTVIMGTAPANSAGWNVVLPAGERFIANPAVSSGVVFMPTYVPQVGKTGGCTVDGSNWLFGLNTSDGSAGLSQVRMGTPDGKQPGPGTAGVALATGGNAPVRDVTTAVVPRLAPPEKKPGEDPPTPGAACMMQVSVAGAPPMYLPYPCGRQSWRQIK